MNTIWTVILTALLSFAAGVVAMDVAQDVRAPVANTEERAIPNSHPAEYLPFIERADRAAVLKLVCQHYQATGRPQRCVQS